MLRARALVAGMIAGLALAAATQTALAQSRPDAAAQPVPDDTPWTVDNADPGTYPETIEELLERDRRSITEDHDITPPGQDQPDYVANPNSGQMEEDRLSPKLPAEIYTARERAPDVAIRTLEPSAAAPAAQQPANALSDTPSAVVPVRPLTPMAPAATAAQGTPAAQAAGTAPAPRPALSPQPAGPAALAAPAAPVAPAVPPAGDPRAAAGNLAPRAPDPVTPAATPPALATPAPDAHTVAQEAHDPAAPPPLAVPSEPVTQAAVAVNGKLYLPLKRYFETNGEAIATFDGGDRAALAAFYEKSVGEALWVSKEGFNAAAQSLMAEIAKADDWGLASIDYTLPALMPKDGEYAYEDLTQAEVRLSLVAMEYARHARGDRIDTPSEQLSSYIDRKPQLIEAPKLLEALAAASDKGAYLRSLHPKHAQFELLREKLLQLRHQQTTGTEPEKIASGPKITPGKEHWQVALVRQRLGTPLPTAKPDGSPADENYYDEALARAVIDYKTKRQIEPINATITDELRKSLNAGAAIDEDMLIANMEQWRWMPETLGDTHIFVNIPEFLVRVKKNDQIIHEERVVTGRYETQTPVFSKALRTVVFQPSWKVPESIKVNELLPKLRAGANPIESQGLRMERNGRQIDAWDVDWSRQDIRNYNIYQPPGDANVLGIVKFLFPNKHSVYLHDTPSKRLFNEKVRTFSHGCMRVRNPVRLAEVIMAEDKGWDKDKVNEMITTGPEDNDVALDKPIPVHVTYFTMWVDDNGDVQTFADIYGHEKRIKLGLHGRWEEIQKNPDHLAPPDPGAVVSREDWGDEDADAPRVQRRRRVSYEQPRQLYRAPPPPPQYRQVQPPKKPFSSFMNSIFGSN